MSSSAGTPPRPALFLDRDGIVNVDHGYVHRREQFEFIPGIFELTRYAAEIGWPVVIATNQSGIGRGYFDEAAFADLTGWMCAHFAAEGGPIAAVYHCPYHPEAGIGPYGREHPWRKPQPGMILQAAADLGLDLPRSALVGDSPRDIVAAAAAGIGLRILVGSDATPGTPAHRAVANLAEALTVLRETTQTRR